MRVSLAECPNCHHQVTITNSSSATQTDKVNCPQCHTVFSADSANSSMPSDQVLLFDDDSGLDSEIEKPASKSLAMPSTPLSGQPKTADVDDFEIIENFDDLPKTPIITPFNDALKEDNPEDTAWLEKLLQEADQTDAVASSPSNPQSKQAILSQPSVANIFDKLDVAIEEDKPTDTAVYQQKLEKRLARQHSAPTHTPNHTLGMTLIWGVGSLLLIAALIVQYTIFNIDNLVTTKATAERLTHFCQNFALPCQLPMADTHLINIEVLKLVSPAQPANQADVVFTLTNTTTHKLIYPNLKISLRSGNTIRSQSILSPHEYVEKGNSYLMPNQVKPFKVRIDYPKAKVDQANIDAFY